MTTNYNYLEAMIEDIREYIEENIDLHDFEDVGEAAENLLDELWIADSVTGNASGSYYCNAYKAREALHGNEDLLVEALEEFGDEAESYKKALTDPEWADVTIRCCLLGHAISEVLDEYDDDAFGSEEEADN